MWLKNIWDDLKRLNIFKRKRTVVTLKEWNVITVKSKNIMYETVASQRSHRILLQLEEALRVLSDKK